MGAQAAGTVRRATRDDLPRVLEVSRRTIRSAYGPILGQGVVDHYTEGDGHDAYYGAHEDTLWVIAVGEKVVGIAALSANMIDLLLIDPAYQGRGLGSRLLSAMEAELFREFDPIALESWEENLRANRFYLERGWLEVGRTVDERTKAPKVLFMKGR